jgi:hypothetical protein
MLIYAPAQQRQAGCGQEPHPEGDGQAAAEDTDPALRRWPSASRRACPFILFRICTPPNLHKNRIELAGFGWLAHQEVEQHGQQHRGDNGEEDHQQAPRSTAQWPYV